MIYLFLLSILAEGRIAQVLHRLAFRVDVATFDPQVGDIRNKRFFMIFSSV